MLPALCYSFVLFILYGDAIWFHYRKTVAVLFPQKCLKVEHPYDKYNM